jgi:hypothetical protein
MLHGFDDASCAPEVVKPRVHEDPIDDVHQLTNLTDCHRRLSAIGRRCQPFQSSQQSLPILG